MEKKVCSKCKKSKKISMFNKRKNAPDGLAYWCKSCNKKNCNKFYNDNTEHVKRETYKNKVKRKEENREKMLAYLKTCTCTDCSNPDIRVLEFDHLGNKHKDVNEMLQTGYSWNTIMKEVAKCEVVCCNCHRIRTFERTKTYRNEDRRRKNGGEDSESPVQDNRGE